MPVIQHGGPPQTIETSRQLQALLMQIAAMNQTRAAQQQQAWTQALGGAGQAIGTGIARRGERDFEREMLAERDQSRQQFAKDRFAQGLGQPDYATLATKVDDAGGWEKWREKQQISQADVRRRIELADMEAYQKAGVLPYGFKQTQGQQQQGQLGEADILRWGQENAPDLMGQIEQLNRARQTVESDPVYDRPGTRQRMIESIDGQITPLMKELRRKAQIMMPQVPQWQQQAQAQGWYDLPGGGRMIVKGFDARGKPQFQYVAPSKEQNELDLPSIQELAKMTPEQRSIELDKRKALNKLDLELRMQQGPDGQWRLRENDGDWKEVKTPEERGVELSDDEKRKWFFKSLEASKSVDDAGKPVIDPNKAWNLFQDLERRLRGESGEAPVGGFSFPTAPDIDELAREYSKAGPAAPKPEMQVHPIPAPGDPRVKGRLYGPREGWIWQWDGKKLVPVRRAVGA